MALNLADRITIIESPTMQVRVTGVVINYALYLLGLTLGDGTNGTATVGQKAWAREAMRNPTGYARDVSRHVINDVAFFGRLVGEEWLAGSSIPDGDLGGIVENAIRTHFVTEPE